MASLHFLFYSFVSYHKEHYSITVNWIVIKCFLCIHNVDRGVVQAHCRANNHAYLQRLLFLGVLFATEL